MRCELRTNFSPIKSHCKFNGYQFLLAGNIQSDLPALYNLYSPVGQLPASARTLAVTALSVTPRALKIYLLELQQQSSDDNRSNRCDHLCECCDRDLAIRHDARSLIHITAKINMLIFCPTVQRSSHHAES